MYHKQPMHKAVITFIKHQGLTIVLTVAVIALYIWLLIGVIDAI